jgi:L-malate glycosyltransferase
MLRIIHLDTAMEMRGGQAQILLLARKLRLAGHGQLIVSPAESALMAAARAEGFEIQSLPASSPWNFAGMVRLRRVVTSGSFHVVHAHDGRGQTLAFLASLGAPIVRVASRRVAFRPPSWISHRLKYNFTCDGVVAVSQSVRALLVQAGVRPGKVTVIPDGIEFPERLFSVSERSALRAQWKLAPGDFALGHVGAFTPEKGQEIAVRAFRLLVPRFPQIKLLLAGDGPLRHELERRYGGQGCNVRFLGFVKDLTGFLGALDLFLMPSSQEGLGSSALLAMSFGLPVIASRVGGLKEIIDDGATGWLIEEGSPTALSHAIEAAVADAALRRAVGERAREKAHEFTDDIMASRTLKFYQALLRHR